MTLVNAAMRPIMLGSEQRHSCGRSRALTLHQTPLISATQWSDPRRFAHAKSSSITFPVATALLCWYMPGRRSAAFALLLGRLRPRCFAPLRRPLACRVCFVPAERAPHTPPPRTHLPGIRYHTGNDPSRSTHRPLPVFAFLTPPNYPLSLPPHPAPQAWR